MDKNISWIIFNAQNTLNAAYTTYFQIYPCRRAINLHTSLNGPRNPECRYATQIKNIDADMYRCIYNRAEIHLRPYLAYVILPLPVLESYVERRFIPDKETFASDPISTRISYPRYTETFGYYIKGNAHRAIWAST